MIGYTLEKSTLGIELRREAKLRREGQHLARLTVTLDGEPLSAVMLAAFELRVLANRALELARELDQANAEVPR